LKQASTTESGWILNDRIWVYVRAPTRRVCIAVVTISGVGPAMRYTTEARRRAVRGWGV
jgi:hypothetical protein